MSFVDYDLKHVTELKSSGKRELRKGLAAIFP